MWPKCVVLPSVTHCSVMPPLLQIKILAKVVGTSEVPSPELAELCLDHGFNYQYMTLTVEVRHMV